MLRHGFFFLPFMKKLLFLLCLIFCVQFINAQKFQDTIPFRDDLGLIIIPISFNGVEKEFAFDTGADVTIAYGWAKETLKPTKRRIVIRSSSDRSSRWRYYKSGKINLGSRKISGHRILNAPKNEIFTCHKIDGILGTDIIKMLNWKIDYKNKILIMYPSNHFPNDIKNMHELSFYFNKRRPSVFLTKGENRFKFLLDTGAGGSSNISNKDYSLTGLEKLPQIDMFSGSFDVNGIFTSTQPKVIQFPETTSNKVKISPIIYYNDLKSSKIGNKLWRDRSLFMSLKNNKLLVSSSTVKQSWSRYSCSVSFQKGKMRIMSIRKDSEIWKAGARQGDEVLQYNGKVFTDFCGLDTYQRKTMKTGKPITITLVNGKKLSITEKLVFE